MTESSVQIQSVLERHPEIETAIVFGSSATGRLRNSSDVDIAIDTRQPLGSQEKYSLIEELAAATGRAVDLCELRSVGEPLLGQILKHGRRLRGTDESFAQLLLRHLIAQEDFMPYVRRMLAQRRQEWIRT